MKMAEESSWQIVYEHLVLIESHWTQQIQNQQQRNGAILTVTGFLLGFSGFTGAVEFQGRWDEPAAQWFAWGLLALALAVVLGVASMWPSIRIADHPWLQAESTRRLGKWAPDDVYQELANWLAEAAEGDRHRRTLRRRRRLMLAEIFLTVVGLVALGICIGLLLDSMPPQSNV
jgi:hypothetical protein